MTEKRQLVEQFLQQYGWTWEAQPNEDYLVTGFVGKSSAFDILIQVSDPFVILAIVPFVPTPIPECRERFCRATLRANYEMNLAKLGLDPEGLVVMVTELPSENLSYDAFKVTLDAFSFFAESYHLPLLNLSIDPTYRPAGEAELWLADGPAVGPGSSSEE